MGLIGNRLSSFALKFTLCSLLPAQASENWRIFVTTFKLKEENVPIFLFSFPSEVFAICVLPKKLLNKAEFPRTQESRFRQRRCRGINSSQGMTSLLHDILVAFLYPRAVYPTLSFW